MRGKRSPLEVGRHITLDRAHVTGNIDTQSSEPLARPRAFFAAEARRCDERMNRRRHRPEPSRGAHSCLRPERAPTPSAQDERSSGRRLEAGDASAAGARLRARAQGGRRPAVQALRSLRSRARGLGPAGARAHHQHDRLGTLQARLQLDLVGGPHHAARGLRRPALPHRAGTAGCSIATWARRTSSSSPTTAPRPITSSMRSGAPAGSRASCRRSRAPTRKPS